MNLLLKVMTKPQRLLFDYKLSIKKKSLETYGCFASTNRRKVGAFALAFEGDESEAPNGILRIAPVSPDR